MTYALISIAVNAALSIALFPVVGFIAVAIATAFAAWLQVSLLAWRLYRLHHFRPSPTLISRFVRIIVAAAGMAAFLLWALPQLDRVAGWVWDRDWIAVIALSAAGAAVYGALALALGAARLADYKGRPAGR